MYDQLEELPPFAFILQCYIYFDIACVYCIITNQTVLDMISFQHFHCVYYYCSPHRIMLQAMFM